MRELTKDILLYIEFGISLTGIAIIVYGALRAVGTFIKVEVTRFCDENKVHALMSIRADLGVYLLLGLELLIRAEGLIPRPLGRMKGIKSRQRYL